MQISIYKHNNNFNVDCYEEFIILITSLEINRTLIKSYGIEMLFGKNTTHFNLVRVLLLL